MFRAIMLLLCAGTCFAAQPSEEAVKKDLKLFQGKWVLVGGQDIGGKPFDEATKKNVLLIVDGNKFVIKEKDKVTMEGTFTIDPTKKVKTIDVSLKDGGGEKILGIYEIVGDTRKSCMAIDKKVRPDGFRKEAGYISFEWKLAK